MRVTHDLLHGSLVSQSRHPKRDHPWKLRSDAIDGPRSQPDDHAHQTILAFDARAPAIIIPAESHPRHHRSKIRSKLPPDDLLNENGHVLLVINQIVLATVEEQIGRASCRE